MSELDTKNGELSEEFGTATPVEEEAKQANVFSRMLRFTDLDGQLDDEVTKALKKGDFRRVQELTDEILEQDPNNIEARIDKKGIENTPF